MIAGLEMCRLAEKSSGEQSFVCIPSAGVVNLAVIPMSFYEKLKFDANGLIPAIIQEEKTGRVLMMAWMNRASLEKTIETGKTHFWSRSRQKFWMKGEASGHTQQVKNLAFDCDGDTLLIKVEQIGAACHEGYQSCFFRSIEGDGQGFKVTEPQLETPEQIYGKK
jgi:phosphoribosyl-AMP cyclohydrolase